jgi:hypothetical protein
VLDECRHFMRLHQSRRRINVTSRSLEAAPAVDALPATRHDNDMSITAIVENGTIKLPVHAPDGTRVEVTVLEENAASQSQNALDWMKKFAGAIEGPEDFAAEHDHYIHGTPKRAGR